MAGRDLLRSPLGRTSSRFWHRIALITNRLDTLRAAGRGDADINVLIALGQRDAVACDLFVFNQKNLHCHSPIEGIYEGRRCLHIARPPLLTRITASNGRN
jgi:hypothetical protein